MARSSSQYMSTANCLLLLRQGVGSEATWSNVKIREASRVKVACPLPSYPGPSWDQVLRFAVRFGRFSRWALLPMHNDAASVHTCDEHCFLMSLVFFYRLMRQCCIFSKACQNLCGAVVPPVITRASSAGWEEQPPGSLQAQCDVVDLCGIPTHSIGWPLLNICNNVFKQDITRQINQSSMLSCRLSSLTWSRPQCGQWEHLSAAKQLVS